MYLVDGAEDAIPKVVERRGSKRASAEQILQA
jgi:hypothetical protein